MVEELGPVEVSALSYLGRYTDQAAGEPGKTVVIELYRGELAGEPAAASEIRELVWFPESGNREELAPSIRNRILPDLVQRQILPWSLPFKSN